jgi:D-lactate dehydrogenase (cytochrome)
MSIPAIHPNVETDYPDCLRDESRRSGCADGIIFAENEEAVCAFFKHLPADCRAVTLQGGRTGITGGAVPDGGIILNLSRMNRSGPQQTMVDKTHIMRVEPGVLLEDFRSALPPDAFFPPDPTETTASIGGMTACNASGAMSFQYGAMRRHIQGLRVVLPDGDLLELERGRDRADGQRMTLTTRAGRRLEFDIPALTMPSVKHAAGYYSAPGMDAVDLFIGAEGTLGVITAIDCRLSKPPAVIWGAVVFLPDEAGALKLVKAARNAAIRPAAVEYFSAELLELLRAHKTSQPSFGDIPDLPPPLVAALYLEYHHSAAADQEAGMEMLIELLEEHGADSGKVWMADDPHEMARLKAFRHAAPECVNLRIDQRRKNEPRITKLGTDLAVPDEALDTMLQRYRTDLQKSALEFVIFGHIGNNHLHVNILPRSLEEYETGRELYLGWAELAVSLGGSVSAEHGIGKLKRRMLEIQYGTAGINEMRRIKQIFDPAMLLNPGNLF